MESRIAHRIGAALLALCAIAAAGHAAAGEAADEQKDRIGTTVERAVRPLIEQYAIAGMAVGVTVGGKPYVFNYGVASLETRRPVTDDTLFELGSVSKTFTATLAAQAQASGALSLSDPVGRHLPSLQGSPFGEVSLLALATHTPGGLPLQVPDGIGDEEQLLRYFKAWRPDYPAGTRRTYANPGIGTLGLITARRLGQAFPALLERRLFPALGMRSSYVDVPAARMADYAQGYAKDGKPVRLTAGVLSAEAYGVKSTAADLLRFVQANLDPAGLEPQLRRAIADTHTGYFQAGPMTQDLIWEQYRYPVALKTLLAGNSAAMIFEATPVAALRPPLAPRQDVWINKTGSTNGFGAYVAFIPARQLGIVILANRNFPIDDRVRAAHAILGALADGKR